MALCLKERGYLLLPLFEEEGGSCVGGNQRQLLPPKAILNKEFHCILCAQACLGGQGGWGLGTQTLGEGQPGGEAAGGSDVAHLLAQQCLVVAAAGGSSGGGNAARHAQWEAS